MSQANALPQLPTGMRFDSSLVTIYVEGRSYNLKIGMYYSVVLTLISPRGKRGRDFIAVTDRIAEWLKLLKLTSNI